MLLSDVKSILPSHRTAGSGSLLLGGKTLKKLVLLCQDSGANAIEVWIG